MLRTYLLALGAVPILALTACGGAGGGAREPGALAAAYEGPILSSDVEQGRQLHDNLCLSCHARGAPAIANLGWTAAAMRRQIREGEGRMPAFSVSRLSDADLESLLAFLVTIGGVQGDAPGAESDEG